MEVQNNPAGRLYDILMEAKRKQGGEQTRKVLGDMFGVQATDTSQILLIWADLITLSSEAKEALNNLENIDHEIYLKPFIKLEKVLSTINLNQKWQTYSAEIDENTMYGLQFCSDTLGRSIGYSSIENKQISELQKEIEELAERIINTELPSELKDLIINNLENLRRALVVYRINGIDGLQREFERTVGSLVLHHSEIKNLEIESAGKHPVTDVFELMEKINKVITFAKTTKEIAAPIFALLTGS
jgi:hypothetical protein